MKMATMAIILRALLLSVLIISAVADPCLSEDHAESNYGTCCANGGYKIEGHGAVCKIVAPRVKGRARESALPSTA